MMIAERQESINRLATRILELCPRIVDPELRSELECLAASVITETRNANTFNSEPILRTPKDDDFEEDGNGIVTSLRHRF